MFLIIVPSVHLAKHVQRLAALLALSLALSGCQGISGTPQFAQVRFIDASPDTPAVDVYQNTSAIAYNLGFGTITSYIPVTPGGYTIAVNLAGSQQQLSAVRATFTLGGQFTVLTGNVAASLQMTVLKDQTVPAPSGQVALRFLDQATRIAGVDIYLLPPGGKLTGVAPVATNVSFGTNTGYLNVPANAYTLVAVPTGTVPTGTTSATYTGTQINYPGSAARTLVLIDQQLVTSPGLQVILADDYDSPSATS